MVLCKRPFVVVANQGETKKTTIFQNNIQDYKNDMTTCVV